MDDRAMDERDMERIDYFRTNELVDDPFPFYDALREKCPVLREPHHNVVMVTGYDEAIGIYSDPKTFSSCNTATGPFPGFPVALEGDDVSDLIEEHRYELPLSREIISLDGDEHAARRALLMRHFTPKRLKETEVFMRRLADRLIDEFAERGECEFTSEFAGPFTLLVIAELLGVPEEDHEGFRDDMLGPRRDRGLGSTTSEIAHDPWTFLHARFTGYLEERRATPRDDVLTSLATTPFPDGSMPEMIELVRLASILFIAGQETTTQLLGSALRLIAEHPDLQDLLRNEPERIANFVEETLRMEAPIKGNFRLSRVAKGVDGHEIPAGSTVMLVNIAANRDPRRFECPHEFRIDRENARQHLTFGHGIHLCAGAALARAEARVGIGRILERMRDIRISEAAHGSGDARTFEYEPSYMTRGLRNLHLEFEPDAPPAQRA